MSSPLNPQCCWIKDQFMNLMPYKIPPGPPLGKGGAFESPPLTKGDLGGFLSNWPLKSTALPLIPSCRGRGNETFFEAIEFLNRYRMKKRAIMHNKMWYIMWRWTEKTSWIICRQKSLSDHWTGCVKALSFCVLRKLKRRSEPNFPGVHKSQHIHKVITRPHRDNDPH